MDSSERPVSGARVQLWTSATDAVESVTDPEGAFALKRASTSGPAYLTVERMGMQTRTIELGAGDTVLTVQLDERPAILEPLTVQALPARVCPNREDPAARIVWEAMRSRYWQATRPPVFVFGFLESRRGAGDRADVYDPGVGEARSGWTLGAPVTSARGLPLGYANAVTQSLDHRTAFWYYRALDRGTIQDFTEDYFGENHSFSVLDASADRTVLGFCPRGRMREVGQLEGLLAIGSDTTLLWARWRFRTPRPDEDAGGEATYYPPAPELGRPLLARETHFWRRTTHGRYFLEARSYSGWRPWDGETPIWRDEHR